MNSEQQAAIKASAAGHVAVIAGPGTGKTHTLINALLDRLDSNVPAETILALTFTNKAVDEMKARLKKVRSGRLPLIATFHGWAYRQVNHKLSSKKVVDAFSQRQHVLELKKQTGVKHTLRELGLIISRCKNGRDQTPKNLALVTAYDELLTRDNLIDFDDLLRLYLAVELLKPSYKYVFVDEFQDTSPLQYQLLKRFIDNGARLFVIGDPNQSIYGFRGAGGEAFDKFLVDYSPTIIRLTKNYRSAGSIVAASGSLFPKATQQSVSQQAGTVKVIETLDPFSQADYIIRAIEHALGGTDWAAVHHDERPLAGDHFHDFAVLYRQNRQGQRLAERLRSAGLPVQVTGEDSPYATPLAQAVLAVFLYLSDPGGETKHQLTAAVRVLGNKASLAWLDALQVDQPPAQLAAAITEQLGQTDKESSFQTVLNGLSQQPDLKTAVAYWQSLAEQEFYDPRADCITLSTIHASKGLEFRHVFIAGCNDGVLPSKSGDLDEEKRLLYVAITRAIESLTLLYCQQIDGKTAEPSRFLTELPDSISHQTDDQLATIEKRRTKARLKRSQQSLF